MAEISGSWIRFQSKSNLTSRLTDTEDMRRNFDELYTFFERHLFSSDMESITHIEFVNNVVEDYWSHFSSTGTILEKYAIEIREDLEDEVFEMLRKKTYGYYSIQDFRQAVSKKSKPA